MAKKTTKNTTKKAPSADVGRKRTDRKSRYGVVTTDQSTYVASAMATGSSSRVDIPLIKIEGVNIDVLDNQFELPKARDYEEDSLEIGFRILGFPVTEKLLNHLPTAIQSDQIGNLLPFFPFSFHRRFGDTFSDRVCTTSVRAGACPICKYRRELFRSPEFERGSIDKYDIMGANFGTRAVAVFFAMIYFDGEVTGPHPTVVNLTNEKSSMARFDNFFDLVDKLTTPKRLIKDDVLPLDYYADGEGSRWLIAEYTRAIYAGESTTPASTKPRKGGYPYWKLSSISPVEELMGEHAADIWWPDVETDDGVEDGAKVVDVFDVLNVPDLEEIQKIADDAAKYLLRKNKDDTTGVDWIDKDIDDEEEGDDIKDDPRVSYDLDSLTWSDLVEMNADELVEVGEDAGGDAEELELLGVANESRLRRSVAKMLDIKPSRGRRSEPNVETAKPANPVDDDDGYDDDDYDDGVPF